MARPVKPGLDYFNIDCVQNDDLNFIEARFGLEGFAIVLKLWQKIYKAEGYYMSWNERSQYLFSREINISLEKVQAVIDCCMDPLTQIFDRRLYEQEQILTSEDVQSRWLKVMRECKRKGVSIKEEYNLLKEESRAEASEAVVEAEERRHPLEEEADKSPENKAVPSGIVPEKFRVFPEVFQKIQEETTQRKEKEIKVKEIKEEERVGVPQRQAVPAAQAFTPAPQPPAPASAAQAAQAFVPAPQRPAPATAPAPQAFAPASAGSPKSSLEDRKLLFRKKMDEVAAGRSAEGMPLMNAPNYTDAMLQKFFQYWTECNTNGRKMRFEMEKVFEMARRLATWKAKEEEFSRQRTFNHSAGRFNTNPLKPLGYEPKKRPGGYGTL